MDNASTAPHVCGMAIDTDIVIAGGGLNGTTLAVALASAGFDVTLVDPRPTTTRAAADFDGRGYAMSIASCRVLQALDIWPSLADGAQPILDIKVSDGRTGQAPSPFVLSFDHAEIEEGPMGHLVEDRHLRPALLDAVASRGVTHRDGDSITSHTSENGGVTVSLDSGETLRARVLVGCDGKTSAVARRAGIQRTGWRYGQSSLVCAVAHEHPHRGTAHQLFLENGPLAILPMTGNRAGIVWTERSDTASDIHAMDDDGYLAALQPRFGDFLGAIELIGQRGLFPLELSIANNFVGDRLALLGDAAHAVHPIAGQGLNAGLKDVAALSQVLTDA
ncbi:MAG: FAD-dependent monooxygenase, partial [Pseudomonadota bacterium]